MAKKREFHGMTKHPAYLVWASMINRCHRKNVTAFKNYGGRGIKVCASWRKSFLVFWRDMGPTYEYGLHLERRDNSKGYTKNNCYWSTRLQQGQNKRNNRILLTPWGRICLAEAARRSGIGLSTLKIRIRNKWPTEYLFVVPDSTNRYSSLLNATKYTTRPAEGRYSK